MIKLTEVEAGYPNKTFTDDEAKAVIRKVEEALASIPELKEGCVYFVGVSAPTDRKNDEGSNLARTAHFMTSHPHTAILVGTGMASVHPSLLSDMAAYLARIQVAPVISNLMMKQLEDQAEESKKIRQTSDSLIHKPN